jgi:hypothetical protein
VSKFLSSLSFSTGIKCIAAYIQDIFAVDPNYKVSEVFEPMEKVLILAEGAAAQVHKIQVAAP